MPAIVANDLQDIQLRAAHVTDEVSVYKWRIPPPPETSHFCFLLNVVFLKFRIFLRRIVRQNQCLPIFLENLSISPAIKILFWIRHWCVPTHVSDTCTYVCVLSVVFTKFENSKFLVLAVYTFIVRGHLNNGDGFDQNIFRFYTRT